LGCPDNRSGRGGACREITESDAHLARVLWLHTLVDAAILRQWLVSSGQRSSLEHAAHLLCELFTRLRVVGLAAHATRYRMLPTTVCGVVGPIGPEGASYSWLPGQIVRINRDGENVHGEPESQSAAGRTTAPGRPRLR
jgi:hypothetical protein